MKKNVVVLTHVMFDNSPYCRYIHNHAKALKDEGYNVIVFAILNWFPFISFFRKKRKEYYKIYKGVKEIDGITVIYKKRLSFSNLLYNSSLNLNGISYYLSIKYKMKKLLKYYNIDFIDAHTFKVEGCAAYLLKKKFKIKTFLTCHGSSLNHNLNTKNGKKQIKKYASIIDKIVCVSDKQKRQLNNLGVFNCVVIHNGINFYDNFTRNNNNYNIITVASLTSDKNVDVVINSFKDIHLKFKNSKLYIVGSGPLENDLRKLVKNEKIEGFVTFFGQISNEEVYKLMSECNIFVLPSSPEGFGIAYVEAMYNGCIPIGTKNEGIDGFIVDGKNGFLVNINSHEIVQKVIYILTNDCDEIRNNCITQAKAMTWKANAKKYIKLLEEINNDR